jgi:hypothetical protein
MFYAAIARLRFETVLQTYSKSRLYAENFAMNIREQALEWIEKLPRGTMFEVSEIYSYIQRRFPHDCAHSGLTSNDEEKWKKDSRWPLQDLKMRKMVVHEGTSRSGKWKRI